MKSHRGWSIEVLRSVMLKQYSFVTYTVHNEESLSSEAKIFSK